jgi:hypothetical protein
MLNSNHKASSRNITRKKGRKEEGKKERRKEGRDI